MLDLTSTRGIPSPVRSAAQPVAVRLLPRFSSSRLIHHARNGSRPVNSCRCSVKSHCGIFGTKRTAHARRNGLGCDRRLGPGCLAFTRQLLLIGVSTVGFGQIRQRRRLAVVEWMRCVLQAWLKKSQVVVLYEFNFLKRVSAGCPDASARTLAGAFAVTLRRPICRLNQKVTSTCAALSARSRIAMWYRF